MKSNLRNEIKSYIVRSGYTMQEVVDQLSEDYGWSDSVSNLSNKLQMSAVLTHRISRPHLQICRFGDGWQSGFAKSALPVSGRNEEIEIAERLSVTPPFEDLGTTHKPLKAARHPQMPHSPSESPRHFAALRDESVIVGYYTSRRKCIPVPQPSAIQRKGADFYGQKRRNRPHLCP